MSQLFPHPAALPAPASNVSTGLAALALTMLLSSLGTSVANVALPTLARELGASFEAVQWVVLAYLLAVTTLVVSIGRMADLIGRRRLMLGGIALFTIASAACAAADGLWMLIAARVVQGAGAAVMMTLSMALVADAAPEGRAGRAMGLLGAVSAAGTALGPSLGGLLIGSFGWPWIFGVNVPLGVLAALLAWRHLPRDASPGRRPSFDLVGSGLLATTLVAYALAMTVGRGSSGPLFASLSIVSIAGAGLFVLVESRAPAPLVRLQLFRDRVVGPGFAMSALATTVAMTTLVVGPFYLSGALGLAPGRVGAVMTAGPLVAALAGMPAGRGVDRFGAHVMTRMGLAAMAAGSVALAMVQPDSGIGGYVLPLVVTTAGFASFQAANNTAVVAGTDPGQRGVVAGLLNLSRNLGLITGASAMGAVFALASGTGDIARAAPAAVVAGTHGAFALAALLTGAALLLAFAAPKTPRSR